MKTLRTLALGALLLGCGGDSSDWASEAQPAAEAWLTLVDAGDYGGSWDQAAAFFKGAVTREQWTQQVGAVRRPLGAVSSRELISAQPATSLPNAPDGEYVVIQFRAAYANRPGAVETVTPMRDADGVWRVSGYYIR